MAMDTAGDKKSLAKESKHERIMGNSLGYSSQWTIDIDRDAVKAEKKFDQLRRTGDEERERRDHEQ
jgi:hypothetical protein